MSLALPVREMTQDETLLALVRGLTLLTGFVCTNAFLDLRTVTDCSGHLCASQRNLVFGRLRKPVAKVIPLGGQSEGDRVVVHVLVVWQGWIGDCSGVTLSLERVCGKHKTASLYPFILISAQARRPAEFKHIIKRRKRN